MQTLLQIWPSITAERAPISRNFIVKRGRKQLPPRTSEMLVASGNFRKNERELPLPSFISFKVQRQEAE
jgi:hypothetical protein